MALDENLFLFWSQFHSLRYLRADGDSSVLLEPVQIAGHPAVAVGRARLATSRGDEAGDTNLGLLAVGLGDGQGATRVTLRLEKN